MLKHGMPLFYSSAPFSNVKAIKTLIKIEK